MTSQGTWARSAHTKAMELTPASPPSRATITRRFLSRPDGEPNPYDRGRHNQNRGDHRWRDLFANTADQKAVQSRPPVRTGDNQVRSDLACPRQHRRLDVPLTNVTGDRHGSGGEPVAFRGQPRLDVRTNVLLEDDRVGGQREYVNGAGLHDVDQLDGTARPAGQIDCHLSGGLATLREVGRAKNLHGVYQPETATTVPFSEVPPSAARRRLLAPVHRALGAPAEAAMQDLRCSNARTQICRGLTQARPRFQAGHDCCSGDGHDQWRLPGSNGQDR